MKSEYNVVFLGEADTGKTSLMRTHLDSSFSITKPTTEERNRSGMFGFWGSQYPAFNSSETKTTPSGKKVKINYKEVMGSRGRMSNYHEVFSAMKTADLVVYCASNQWHLRTMNWNVLKSTNKTSMENQKKNFPHYNVHEKLVCPTVLVQTQFDLKSSKDFASNVKSTAETYQIEYIQTSALNKTNVEETFNLIFAQLGQYYFPNEMKTADEKTEKTECPNIEEFTSTKSGLSSWLSKYSEFISSITKTTTSKKVPDLA